MKVDTVGGSGEEETMKVRCEAYRGSPGACVARESLKLLIFNVHGTLQFALGQEMWLTNPRSHRQKVAICTVF
jgi:hypothetical protein